jgi:hypothetical protein
MGLAFPSTYFQHISQGACTKALGFGDLAINLVALATMIVVYLLIALALLKTQEA